MTGSSYVTLSGIRFFIENADNVQIPLQLLSPFQTAAGTSVAQYNYAPPTFMRYTVSTSDADGSSLQSVRVDLAGRMCERRQKLPPMLSFYPKA